MTTSTDFTVHTVTIQIMEAENPVDAKDCYLRLFLEGGEDPEKFAVVKPWDVAVSG